MLRKRESLPNEPRQERWDVNLSFLGGLQTGVDSHARHLEEHRETRLAHAEQ